MPCEAECCAEFLEEGTVSTAKRDMPYKAVGVDTTVDGILHHLGCMKPQKQWDKLPTSTGEVSGFQPSTVVDFFVTFPTFFVGQFGKMLHVLYHKRHKPSAHPATQNQSRHDMVKK